MLIVDDDGDLLETLGQVLDEQAGHRVVSARDGTAALDFLLRPDVPLPCFIVLDLMMPIVNGWQVLSFLKTHDRWAELPVIVVSTSMNEETLREAQTVRFLR
ncbi:MAG TPA: response regulator, partial [Solirubrobacteraceae bacterium]|nr:response regulator [Solirubrobacteraceae bacterium]